MSSPHQGIQPWIVEQSEDVQDYRIFTLRRLQVRSAGNDRRGEFYVLDSPNWVNVVPVTPEGELVMVSQYRIGSGQVSLEIPAGLMEPDEEVEAAAARELREETGYTAHSFSILGSTFANPAFMSNRFTAVLAEDVTLTDPTAWDEHEELEVRLVPASSVPDLLASGEVTNTYSVLTLSLYLLRQHGILPPDR